MVLKIAKNDFDSIETFALAPNNATMYPAIR